ncbi:MAG: metallophosphoesterase family protein [Bacteroidales bacterium]
MNILVISDLHIDPHDAFGIFQWNEMDLIMQIERIRDIFSIDKVIFNGDTYELYKYSLDEINKSNPLLTEYFRNKDFIFIKGNHDLLSDIGLDFYQITNSKGQTIHIEHGHNADWLNGTGFGRALCRFGFSLLKKMAHNKHLLNFYFKLVAFDDQINRIPKKYNSIRYLSYAIKLLKDNDMVILGHTHKLEAHHTYYLNKKKRYLNCGSCSLGRFQAVVLDTETLKYEMIKENMESISSLNRESLQLPKTAKKKKRSKRHSPVMLTE